MKSFIAALGKEIDVLEVKKNLLVEAKQEIEEVAEGEERELTEEEQERVEELEEEIEQIDDSIDFFAGSENWYEENYKEISIKEIIEALGKEKVLKVILFDNSGYWFSNGDCAFTDTEICTITKIDEDTYETYSEYHRNCSPCWDQKPIEYTKEKLIKFLEEQEITIYRD